ncbi:sodium channel protein Nach [Helicoverpa armigera]|uniref:sodium channel protein Nach n=1 Tax=Helicoverpa armigera TaxID=29058 RepID=UPI003083540A
MLKITVKEKPTFKRKRDNYARKLKTQKLINYLQSELRSSTTHGLPYIANTEIHWFERLFWAACFILSCAIIFVLLTSQYTRLVEAPIVNSVEKDYLNWNVSYPAIVLCPVTKIDDEVFAYYINETLNRTGYNLEAYYSAIMSVSLEALNVLDLPPPEILELIKPEEYATIAVDLFKKFKNTTLQLLLNWPITVDTTMTEMGLCHIINSNVAILDDPTKWSDSSVAYAKNNIELSVHDIDFFVQLLNYTDVFKIYTVSPDEVILIGTPALTFETEGFLSFGVQITSTRASEDIKDIPLQLRNCRFRNEVTSNRYPIYSYNRCLIDCRIKMIFKLCDCIPHFYKPLAHERICNLAELECLLEHKKQITTLSTYNETMGRYENIDDLPRSFRDCGCLGNCEEDVFKNDRETYLPQEAMNRVRVSVSAFPKVRVMREIIFSFYDLFLRSGGVVNLCIGASVISIMELLLIALRIPIYEIMQIVKGIWRRYKKSQLPRLSNNKKQM